MGTNLILLTTLVGKEYIKVIPQYQKIPDDWIELPPNDEIHLSLNGVPLSDWHACPFKYLSEPELESSIVTFPHLPNYTIHYKLSTNATGSLRVSKNTTVLAAKQIIAVDRGLRSVDQLQVVSPKVRDDSQTMAEVGLTEETLIYASMSFLPLYI